MQPGSRRCAGSRKVCTQQEGVQEVCREQKVCRQQEGCRLTGGVQAADQVHPGAQAGATSLCGWAQSTE